jgi:anti-sigma B factor antagonist
MVTTKDPPSGPPHSASADNNPPRLSNTAASQTGNTPDDTPLNAGSELLELTVKRPAIGVCVVTVGGELDMLTAPALQVCLQQQLSTNPSHLVMDLQGVSFLDSKGLNCLLQARETTQTTNTQLHLAGLVTRAVARPLQVSQLLELFTTYPTITQALAAILR